MRILSNYSKYVLGGALALAVPFCVAQSNPGQMQSGSMQASANPARSMSANQQAADLLNSANKAEIADGQWIAGHSKNSMVKNYANNVVNDHKSVQKQLKSIAGESNLKLMPDQMLEQTNDRLQSRLKKESPTQADLTYLKAQVRIHKMLMQKSQQLEPRVTNDKLQMLLKSAIPVMQLHLKHAQMLAQQLGGAGSGR